MADVNVMSLSNEEIIAELVKGEVTVAEGTERPDLVKAYKEMKKAQAEAQEDAKDAEGKDAPTDKKGKKKDYEVLSNIMMDGKLYHKGDRIPPFKGMEKLGWAVKL